MKRKWTGVLSLLERSASSSLILSNDSCQSSLEEKTLPSTSMYRWKAVGEKDKLKFFFWLGGGWWGGGLGGLVLGGGWGVWCWGGGWGGGCGGWVWFWGVVGGGGVGWGGCGLLCLGGGWVGGGCGPHQPNKKNPNPPPPTHPPNQPPHHTDRDGHFFFWMFPYLFFPSKPPR